MRRLSAFIMLLGAATAALGVFAVFGIERIDLPPPAVRFIAAALPVAVLVIGVALLVLGTVMARLVLSEGKRMPNDAAGPVHAPALGAGLRSSKPDAAERGAAVPRAAAGEHVG
jgi:hypothetical protein